MKFSAGSPGGLWTALLLLAAACTAHAADNSSATTPAGTSKEVTSHGGTTLSPSVEKGNGSVTPAPVTTNATTLTPAAPTHAPNTTHSPSTTQAHPVTSATNSTVTSKVTVKTPAVKTPAVVVTTSSLPTSSISSILQNKSGFDLGSFIGGIVLTLGFLAAVYFGCRFYNSKRGVRYRTIDEHEAII